MKNTVARRIGHFLVLGACAVIGIWFFFIPFSQEIESRRAGASFIVGPYLLFLALSGLWKGKFEGFDSADLEQNAPYFYFCFASLLSAGMGMLKLALQLILA